MHGMTRIHLILPALLLPLLVSACGNKGPLRPAEPAIDPPFDAAIEAAYHHAMDTRITAGQPSGDSHTGRHLFTLLPAAGFDIHAAGSSDWVVHPRAGGYPADEAYFLHFIVATIDGALRTDPTLDQPRFAEWIAQRHAQIERGELVYIAHQLDFCGAAR